MVPQVSVILPARDAVETLPRCLASLARQTLADHEVVAVDDGSADGSSDVLERAARRDPRVRVVRIRRSGLVAALNLRLEMARGMRDYVRWQNRLLDHEAIVREIFVESPLAHPSVMMRTRVLRALGGYRAFDGPEDYDLWLSAHAAGIRFGKLAATLLVWSDGPRRLSRTDPRSGLPHE